MNKNTLAKLINNYKLYAITNAFTTNQVYKVEFYVLYKNNFIHLGNYKSSAIGMSRLFECFLELIKDYGLKLANNFEPKKSNEVLQRYHVLGDNKIFNWGKSDNENK